MKILHVLYELKFSGAEIMYVDAADEFRSLGCELYVINSAERLGKYADMFKDAGYKVYHLPCPSGLITRWSYCQQIVRLVKKEGIDVIHTHASNMKWDMALVACLAGIRSVYTFHSCFKSRPISYLYHIWLRWSAKNLLSCKFQTISDSVYDNERLYYHNDTIKIYNWFGNKRFFPADKAEKQAVRKELGISKDSFVIISVGGCSVNKRHHDIIKALPDLLKEKNNLKIENTKLSLTKIIENYQDITQNTLDLSVFIENYKNNKNSKYTEQNNQIIMETTALAENKYQKYEKLYISKETGKPEKMEIKDTNQNTIIYIIYNEININTYNANLTHTNIRSEGYGNKKRRYVLC